jgi:hypothetical protein
MLINLSYMHPLIIVQIRFEVLYDIVSERNLLPFSYTVFELSGTAVWI